MTTRPKRKSFGSITGVSMTPMIGTKRTMDNLGTIAKRLTPVEAKAISRMLWAAACARGGVGKIDLTGFRKTGQVTVTRYIK